MENIKHEDLTPEEENLVLSYSEIFPNLSPSTVLSVIRKYGKGDQNQEAMVQDLMELQQKLIQKEEERKKREEEELKKQQAQNEKIQQLQHEKENLARKIEEKKSLTKPPEERHLLSQSITASTLNNLQTQLNKVYEDSFLLMEQKINEQGEEIETLQSKLEESKQRITDLEKELLDAKKDLEDYKASDAINDLVSGIKNVLDDSLLNAAPGADLTTLSVLIKKQLARNFINDFRNYKAEKGKDLNLSMSFSILPSAPPQFKQESTEAPQMDSNENKQTIEEIPKHDPNSPAHKPTEHVVPPSWSPQNPYNPYPNNNTNYSSPFNSPPFPNNNYPPFFPPQQPGFFH